jgi:hypothetical protein
MKQIQFWKRELGALWNPFERERILEFSGIKSNEQVNLSGYVKWVRTKVFVLVPTLFSNQTHILCLNHTDRRPPENAFITISGLSRRYGLRKKNDYSRVFRGDIIVEVYDWKVSKPDFKIPKDETKYEDFKRNLTCRIEGLEPIQKDFLAFTIISTPSIIGQSGGINATLYDSTKSGIPKKVIKEVQLAIPKDMEKICTVKTPLGKFGLRYEYNYSIGDADKPLSNIEQKFLTHNVLGFKEASLSLFSKSDRPLSIEDPPCSLSDIPTVTPETTQIVHDKPYIDQFDALRYLTTSHFKIPIIQDFDDSISTIVTGLERLNDSWDLPPKQIAKYGFLDANYNARPLSVLRQCLAYARAKNVEIITAEWVNQVFDEYFVWNFEYVNEIWEDLLTRPLVDDKTMMASLRVKYREIIRIIRKNYSSKEIGVSKETILKEIEEPPLKVNELLNDCKRDGVIYEPRSGFYKLTREYD